jgi:hypothetical protein
MVSIIRRIILSSLRKRLPILVVQLGMAPMNKLIVLGAAVFATDSERPSVVPL